MSVFFKDISTDNPVQKGDVEKLLEPLGLTIKAEESADYQRLLAAVHDCATRIDSLPDYQPVPDTKRYPRENVHIPTAEEQEFGHAWAHRFLIRGDKSASDSSSVCLKGKTVCLKDCIAVAGVPQFFGSDAFPPWTPSTDATVVTRVLDAGADILGTATCEHFCNSTASFTSAQGTIENPYKEGYSTGGSTSGGAALVCSGKIDIALGTDQGGSIRVPASFCGCVGVKPTHGLVPFTGVTSGDAIDDHAGPICRSVTEAAQCLDVISGYDGIDDKSLGAAAHGSYNFSAALSASSGRLDGFKIGLLREGFDQEIVDPKVKEHVLSAARKLESLGAIVEDARLPWIDSSFQKLFPSTKNTFINGLYLSDKFPGLYSKTVNIGRQISDAYQRLTTNTAVFNVTGHPALSIPVGFVAAKDDAQVLLPVGMQIVGGLWQEKRILTIAHAWETNFDWKSVTNTTEAPESVPETLMTGSNVKVNGRTMPEVNGATSPNLKRVKLSV
ncbi:hypothetical protein SGCOL_004275 [Colletotrichum sp. CLE4]